LEDYNPVTGYTGSVGEIRQSIETDYCLNDGDSGVGELEGINENVWDEREDSGLGGMDGFRGQRWMGYVIHQESGVRSSIKRERDADKRRADKSGARVKKSKRLRERR
jgi:hypothetical protein